MPKYNNPILATDLNESQLAQLKAQYQETLEDIPIIWFGNYRFTIAS